MSRRIRSLLYGGAASALIACAGPTLAESADEEARSLPHWVLRAQQRLALNPLQQSELRLLTSANSEKLAALPLRAGQLDEMAEIRREFRAGLARILTPEQLLEWDSLLEDLLGELHLRNSPLLAERRH